MASRPEWVVEFSLAGALSSIKPLGHWWAAVSEERWPPSGPARDYLEDKWIEPWGDRRQEIVFIGSDYNWNALKAGLDACLVPEADSRTLEDLPTYPDPLPQWKVAGE